MSALETDWNQRARCAGVTMRPNDATVCESCPVTAQCYQTWVGLGEHERSANVYAWGGLTPAELLASNPGRRHVDEDGLTRAQNRTLHLIEDEPGLATTEISKRLGQSGNTTMKAVNHLERIGRIERRPGEPRFGPGFPAATFHPLDGHRDFGAGATMSGTGGASTPRSLAHSPQHERTTR